MLNTREYLILAQPGKILDEFICHQILKDLAVSNVIVIYGGNNFNPYVYGDVHFKTMNEILHHFQKMIHCAEKSGTKIVVCGLIPRPKYLHLKKYFQITSHSGLKMEK